MLFSYYNKDDDYIFFDYDSLKSSQVIAYNNRAQIIGDIYISSNSVKSDGAVIANGSTFLSDEFLITTLLLFQKILMFLWNTLHIKGDY